MHRSGKNRQRGFGLAYILTVIALLSLVTFALSQQGRGVAQGRFNSEAKTALLEQSALIRNRIMSCGVMYPAGDNGSGLRVRYPAKPVSGLVSDLICPGQPTPNNLWTGVNSVPLPSLPGIFLPWKYENDGTSLRISTTAAKPGDPSTLGIMDAVISRIGSGASRSGDTLSFVILN